MTANDFRELALRVPGAIESTHMDHPDFRVEGKIFASLGSPDEDSGMVKLTPGQQRVFIEKEPTVFRRASGAWGRSGYTNVHLALAKKTLLRTAIDVAAKNLAPAPSRQSPRP